MNRHFVLVNKETGRPRLGFIGAGVILVLLLIVMVWVTLDYFDDRALNSVTVVEPTATPDPLIAALNANTEAVLAGREEVAKGFNTLSDRIDALNQPAPATTLVPLPTATAQLAEEETATFDLQRTLPREPERPNVASGNGMLFAQADTIPTTEAPLSSIEVGMTGGYFWIDGGVQTATNLEIAQGPFVNTVGLGSQSFLAEPGKMSRYCSDEEFKNELPSYKGAVTCWGETNHGIFTHLGPAYTPAVEGGFKMFTANRGTIEMPNGVTFHFEGDDTTSWIVLIRGKYADFQTPEDRNTNLEVRDYVPGNIEWIEYSGNPNGGFVSEGHYLQIADGAMYRNNSCGREGCPVQFALFYDINTGGWVILTRSMLGDGSLSQWARLATNMDYLQ